jgi:ferredoxin
MKVIKIDQKDWEEGLGKLYDEYRLIGPVKNSEIDQFKELEKGEMPDLGFSNTRLSAKSVVYPQSQIMFEYDLNEKNEGHHVMKPVGFEKAEQALIGVRPCDAASYLIAKKNFDNPDYRDPYWCETYEKTTLVGFACNNPTSTCFCTSVGQGPFNEDGLDVLLVESGDGFQVKIISEKGEKLADQAGWIQEGDAKLIETLKEEAEKKITASIEMDKIAGKSSKDLFEAPFWEDMAFACLNCGTCTYSCPTCWCFDIQDENQEDKGVRMRNWDSCMSPLFTLEGSGHNPRPLKFHRVRQRFMHKLKYYMDKYEDGIMCVGCGRCISLCPVNIDIRKISSKMNNYNP